MSSIVFKASGNQFFDRLPDELITSAFEFLKAPNGSSPSDNNDKAILATSLVCRSWQINTGLQEERKQALSRLKNDAVVNPIYSKDMLEIFRHCHLSVARLPVLDLGNRMGEYIDILKPEDMTHPIMRFKDQDDRPGIAFHIEGYADGSIQYLGVAIPIQNISGVLAVFKRYNDENVWKIGMGGLLSGTMGRLHNDRHKENDHIGSIFEKCPTCPSGFQSGDDANYLSLYNLLTGKDPLFRIAQGHVSPEHPEPMRVAAPAAVVPIRLSEVSERTSHHKATVVTTLAVLVIAYITNMYFQQKSSSP